MKDPPYDDPDWVDGLNFILGVLLVIIIISAALWFAVDTEVTRSPP